MNRDILAGKLLQISLLVKECEQLISKSRTINTRATLSPKSNISKLRNIDTDLPLKPFMKRFAAGRSGPKVFTLLVAHKLKGKIDSSRTVSLREIEKDWKSVTSVIGINFNRAYSNRAQVEDLVDAPRKGQYVLRPSWMRAGEVE